MTMVICRWYSNLKFTSSNFRRDDFPLVTISISFPGNFGQLSSTGAAATAAGHHFGGTME
ncbi:hypothetical protein T4B_14515 [Trichinella pseudospiralis]|uniref:Uncharacterized protein n=1 Tax=Trichinella pseudospiralis TaxID=6337 RepID=A0A0V1IV44_TRIPS|nr:hypothetical protein T4A_4954 [Trichinella pseudospiralis]KRZ26650.1 hypothetical protein T4B_14515 [Trichinella pseudospiralis]